MRLLQNKIETREKTFKNISQEIHDNIGQLLTLIKINLDTLESPSSEGYEKKISNSQELLAKSQNDLHQLSLSLKAGAESQVGIAQYIESELELISKTAMFQTNLVVEGQPINLGIKENALNRICQEAFNNIIKHSNAKHIFVEIIFRKNVSVIKIADDGKGYSLSKVKESTGNYGLGLRNMRNRAKSIDAELIVQSTPGSGTVITIEVKNQ
jgi:two-component system NarL family sensor kinase